MNANEGLILRLHEIAYALRNERSDAGQAILDALRTWQTLRLREIRLMTDYLDNLAHTMPGEAPPRAPTERAT